MIAAFGRGASVCAACADVAIERVNDKRRSTEVCWWYSCHIKFDS